MRFGAASRRVLALDPGSPSTPLRSVPGVRETAVERFALIFPPLSRAHAAKAEYDPGPSARLCREAASNSFRRGLLPGEARSVRVVGRNHPVLVTAVARALRPAVLGLADEVFEPPVGDCLAQAGHEL